MTTPRNILRCGCSHSAALALMLSLTCCAIGDESPGLAPELEFGMYPGVLITGAAGSRIELEYATELTGRSNWITLTNFILPTPQLTLLDASAIGRPQRFYRVLADLPSAPANPLPSSLVLIPPGRFIMGTPAAEQGRAESEGPQTHVTFTYWFFIGKCEVTQAEYNDLMGTNPSMFTDLPTLPVERVSWRDATNYCGKLTQALGAGGVLPASYVCRLPTEAEWEYACRAGTVTRFSFGDDSDGLASYRYAWHALNSDGITHPVGTKLANPWGIHDMHGNVREWCWPQGKYPGGAVVNPEGVPPVAPDGPAELFPRGGGALSSPVSEKTLRSGSRREYWGTVASPTAAGPYTGFRVVVAPPLPW